MGRTTLIISIGMLAGFSLIFFMVYADSQYGYHTVWDVAGWWLDKVIPPLAIVVVVIVFISEQRSINRRRNEDETKTIRRSCDTILKELEEFETALYGEKYDHTTDQDDGIDYTNVHLNTVAFTSISNSALFTQFGSETQNQLSNLYLRVSIYNDEFDYAFILQDNYNLGPTTPGSEQYYQERKKDIERHLTSMKNEIKNLLPLAKKLVKSEKTRSS